jgi:4-methyl-5(b-hydroxyethyl)-thiazole monophosphate biosynthesis
MARVLVPLAEGFEEIEAVTVIDLLRRAGIEVVGAGLVPGPVRAARGTVIVPDTTLDAVLAEDFDMVVLPGGGPGAERLARDARIRALLVRMEGAGRKIAAICAAPRVLAEAGLLTGRRATAFPGSLDGVEVPGLDYREEPVVVDGRITTSRGPGTAMDFALTLVERLAGREACERVAGALQRP